MIDGYAKTCLNITTKTWVMSSHQKTQQLQNILLINNTHNQ